MPGSQKLSNTRRGIISSSEVEKIIGPEVGHEKRIEMIHEGNLFPHKLQAV